MTGLTQEQRTLLEGRYCEAGHRFDGVNYPTPEGLCPLCTWTDVKEDVRHYQLLLAEQTSTFRGPVHPSLLTHSER